MPTGPLGNDGSDLRHQRGGQCPRHPLLPKIPCSPRGSDQQQALRIACQHRRTDNRLNLKKILSGARLFRRPRPGRPLPGKAVFAGRSERLSEGETARAPCAPAAPRRWRHLLHYLRQCSFSATKRITRRDAHTTSLRIYRHFQIVHIQFVESQQEP